MNRRKKILYAGDSAVGGPANYLLGLLRYHNIKTIHFTPNQKLSYRDLNQKLDAVIFSDYSRRQVSGDCERAIEAGVQRGLGFLMIGGWGSFSGPFGGWKGSVIEKVLPVSCLSRDDRMNFPGGALIIPEKSAKPVFENLSFKESPSICGANRVKPKTGSKTLLNLCPVINRNGEVRLSRQSYPLLVIDADPQRRVGAFMTDFAPHWCGGFVDWGNKTVKIKVTGTIQIEIGNFYTAFAGKLLDWLLQG